MGTGSSLERASHFVSALRRHMNPEAVKAILRKDGLARFFMGDEYLAQDYLD